MNPAKTFRVSLRPARARLSGPAPLWQGNEHGHLLAVASVLVAEEVDEVALLELDGDQDVRGRGTRKQQLAGGHDWCCIERLRVRRYGRDIPVICSLRRLLTPGRRQLINLPCTRINDAYYFDVCDSKRPLGFSAIAPERRAVAAARAIGSATLLGSQD